VSFHASENKDFLFQLLWLLNRRQKEAAMKAALYVRVSTSTQTTANQKLELEAYCNRQGWPVVECYDDSGISGSGADLSALERLMSEAGTGRFAVVVVYKLDRLGRSTMHLLQVLQRLQAAGVAFVATTQQIDTTTAYGRMLVTFLAAVAEFEKSLIADRVKSGMARAKAEGVHCGRPRKGFDVAKAVLSRKEGVSFRGIAKAAGVSSATVFRALSAVPKG
jgi:DNA invertase Pin-like site-specific DNA recombinase